jgi:hypothetical protein
MLQLKPKQKLAVDSVNDPTVDTLVLFGTVGTGKTDVAAHIVISICLTFSKTYWPVFRANLTTAKKTVIQSYEIMLDRMNLVEGDDYTFNRTDYYIKFKNGSIIPFVEADFTKDRQGRKIKGINASGNHIDEGDELNETMLVTATSRKGRRNEQGQPSLSIHTLNPTDHPYYTKLYNSYKNPGGKDESGMIIPPLPKGVKCIEFTVEDSWQTQQDIDALMSNPKWWVERYMRNNWKYKDEEKTIFKSHLFAKAKTNTLVPGRRSAGYDVADEGRDRAGAADWENFTLFDIQITKEADQKVKTEDQADWLIQHSNDLEIGYENIAVDGVGVGVGLLSSARVKGVDFAVFKSGFSPDPYLTFDDKPLSKEDADKNSEVVSFSNLRSQVAYLLAMGMEKGVVKILDSCPYLDEFISEAQQHHNETNEKVFKLESKDKIKERTGSSPDIFDMVLMGFWKQLKKEHRIEYGGLL